MNLFTSVSAEFKLLMLLNTGNAIKYFNLFLLILMAILGFHIIVTLISATLFNKFQPQFTLCERLVYRGLKYYFLTEPPDSNDGRLRRKGRNKSDPAPGDYHKELFSMIMQKEIFVKLSYYPSLLWLIDYSFVSLVVFTCSQIFIYFFPNDNSTNVSVLWTVFTFTFALQILFKLLWKKFVNQNLGAERNLIFSFSLVTFLVFMLIHMFADSLIDENLAGGKFRLLSPGPFNNVCVFVGYENLINNTKLVAENEITLRLENSSPLFLFVFASFLASLLGAAHLMPVVQYTSLYRQMTEGKKSIQT